MAEAAQLRADRPPGSPDWLLEEGALWPWIGRFLWSPALDLHPSRRPVLLPRWPEEAWSDRAVLAHVSRHLLSAHALLGELRWDSRVAQFRLALLPGEPLARLARRIGLALHGPAAGAAGAVLDESERAFLTQRAPLYWRTAHVTGEDPAGTGWAALRILTGNQPDAVKRRFVWKTPITPGRPAPLPDSALLLALTRKILKEFEEPWSSLFETLRRPDRQIRLCG